ncbi:hypothetical protein GQ602_005874 [Ophiocordyceps camponoti-floridani]|uniref:Uncharacterized protein n=1 Tax=Ophiocordyceps camponoti-floridani TaxID=2030778 RepID=A0A8H4VCA1_9HYPO|nr:hypothetical protein GQ602_005874 [Ophiocordyceps camponoti-floridani]
MGGRIWDKNEEEHFWRKIVPRSPVAADGKGLQLSWAVLAEEMRSKFGRSRREYTWLMLYEHWYQNARTGHSSPNGRHLVAEYKRQIATCVKPAGVTKPLVGPGWPNGQYRGRLLAAVDRGHKSASQPLPLFPPRRKPTSTAASRGQYVLLVRRQQIRAFTTASSSTVQAWNHRPGFPGPALRARTMGPVPRFCDGPADGSHSWFVCLLEAGRPWMGREAHDLDRL